MHRQINDALVIDVVNHVGKIQVLQIEGYGIVLKALSEVVPVFMAQVWLSITLHEAVEGSVGRIITIDCVVIAIDVNILGTTSVDFITALIGIYIVGAIGNLGGHTGISQNPTGITHFYTG